MAFVAVVAVVAFEAFTALTAFVALSAEPAVFAEATDRLGASCLMSFLSAEVSDVVFFFGVAFAALAAGSDVWIAA
jgi:hypothetical protein